MKTFLKVLLFTLLSASANAADKVPAHPHIQIETTMGVIRLELDGRRAPITVAVLLVMLGCGSASPSPSHAPGATTQEALPFATLRLTFET